MSARKASSTPPLPKASILLHWLILIAGLALLTALRIDELDKMTPLWVGSVFGTAIGQLLAYRRMRLWLFAFIALNLTWLGPLTLAPLWPLLAMQPWASMETFVVGFLPAAFCGYYALSERGALLSFWYPAVPWMVAILDRGRGATLDGEERYLLLGGLGVLLLGLLRARETRRVALWRGYALTRLASPRGEAVLREAPLRRAGQLAWMAGIGIATLALTVRVAPSLFQHDEIDRSFGLAVDAEEAGDARTWTCCPDAATRRMEEKRVREYLPTRRPHGEKAIEGSGASGCVACVNGLPYDYGQPTTKAHAGASVPAPATSVAADPPSRDVAPEEPPQGAAAPATPRPTAAPVADKPAPKAPSAKEAPYRPTYAPSLPGARRAAFGPGPTVSFNPFAWVLALVISSAAVQLTMRPLRRLLVLRHLQRPLWAETVDQRVSNLWQWMLIGLRDAGYNAAPGEAPHELARRVGIEGMKTCATVLERARHGVRVDGDDLRAMESAARAVYASARGKIGWAARAASWLRWPLA